MDMQKLIDTMNATSSRERGNYHLTLGRLIEVLKSTDPDCEVKFDNEDIGNPSGFGSYRGYYCDLAIEPSSTPCTVKDLLREAEDAIGNTFEGYKGGDFTMHSETPLWASSWGCSSGFAIMDAKNIGAGLVLITKKID